MTAQSPQSTATEIPFREEVIAFCIEEVQPLILDKIQMSTIDPAFDPPCCETADLGVSHERR